MVRCFPPTRNWFWSDQYALSPLLGISADTWKSQATCYAPLNQNTQPDPSFNQRLLSLPSLPICLDLTLPSLSTPSRSDQFSRMREKTLDQMFALSDWTGFSFAQGGTKCGTLGFLVVS